MEFSILGLTPDATIDEAKKSLKKIQAENHPDKNRDATEKQISKMRDFVCLAEEALERIISTKYIQHRVHINDLPEIDFSNLLDRNSENQHEKSEKNEDYVIKIKNQSVFESRKISK